ncbi:uracil-DNA glycosylase [Terrihabitans soli]|uniref:Type-4 uracil-DNA glycosylase n=1 Tax=Terrihabitans soli TaxID=708113 RepID=A0A6S6QQE0_9HYPH|nr:uracil-DNA glycosylase [Terrihabitans soli]BCJ90187.1 uracil-DNA glycosylase [Terrihabitans soli]
MNSIPGRNEAVQLLAWYAEMGVDLAMEDEPQDRFAETAAAHAVTGNASGGSPIQASRERPLPTLERAPSERFSGERPPLVVPAAASTPAQDVAVADARSRAREAKSLDELRSILETYDGVPLKKTATKLVFADGNPQAKVMFVGEAPGMEEDREGLPFVGRAGQLLDKMLTAVGLDRTSVYIANILPWRPPGNRKPTPQETELCLPFARRQIELVNPDILVLLGGTPTSVLLGKDGIMKLRGQWHDYEIDGRAIKALPTLHPAFLLRTPSQKKFAWRDFRALKAELNAGVR